jgi:hypothetical protein
VDPAEGTLLALGLCHERINANAQAYDELQDALASVVVSGRADRERVARAALDRLRARVGLIVVRFEGDLETFDLRRDGTLFPKTSVGREVALEPGLHAFELRRGDRVVWEHLTTAVAGAASELLIPSPYARVPANDGSRVEAKGPQHSPAADEERASVAAASTLQRPWLGYVLGGAGVGALAVGGAFGLRAFSKWDDARGRCPTSTCGDAAARADADDASGAAMAANVLVGAGLMLLGAAILVLVQPGSRGSASKVQDRHAHAF